MSSLTHALSLSLAGFLTVTSVVGAIDPLEVPWSSMTFGPDGPWPAVEVTIGSDQLVAMYPGREFQSFVLTSEYCRHNTSDGCAATRAGVYNDAESQIDNTGSTGAIQYAPGPNYMLGLNVAGDDATSWIDYMDVGGMSVPNVSMALLSNSYAVYPDETWYPLSVGCLGIGAPGTVNQSFSTSDAPINASLIPGILNAEDQIPSNSFGMHIGSANPVMSGSLYFGGYDQNRIVGEILSYADDITKSINLKDIGIQVIDGASPWSFDTKSGLLAANNDSIPSGGIEVSVDGCSPYLTLPKSTCDAIAKELPVTYNEALGLYIWNTDDAKYSQIVSSASALQFNFTAGSNTETVTINVPFPHLNLTLTQPLVDTDMQYFPCYTGFAGQYTLGRAFLQDAFIGAHWGMKKWWLAQAPGPNIPSANVKTIQKSDTTIQTSSNDWKASWDGSWKALTTDQVTNSSTVTPEGSDSDSGGETKGSSSPSSGLSTGAKAGIGVAAAIGALAVIGALVFFFLRRRRQSSEKSAETSPDAAPYNPQASPAPTHPMHGTPQQGYYAPVKNPGETSPAMSNAYSHSPHSVNAAMYNQQYPQQYAAYPPQQQYSAELTAIGNTPQELPASNMYEPHGSPHPPYPATHELHNPNTLSHELPSPGR
ncbi:aspartic peptidase domain-containing protein [Xylariaceae sp. FL1272]|nr:aspartic peptidase domain-containing protein [Xylariaceae sp. FL1272]